MKLSHGHRWGTQYAATLLAFVLSSGGLFGQVGHLLQESVHVCTCRPDASGEHECECPLCRGPHLAEESQNQPPCHGPGSAKEPEEPRLALKSQPCGSATGEAPELLRFRALVVPPPLLQVPRLHSKLPRPALEPPGRLSLGAPAPEPPPPRAG